MFRQPMRQNLSKRAGLGCIKTGKTGSAKPLGIAGAAIRANWLWMSQKTDLPEDHKSEIVQMALSDHVSFSDIEREYGLGEKDVKALMRDTLKAGSYRTWRKRVRTFADRRERYK